MGAVKAGGSWEPPKANGSWLQGTKSAHEGIKGLGSGWHGALVADVGVVLAVAGSPGMMLWGIYGEKRTGVGPTITPSADTSACSWKPGCGGIGQEKPGTASLVRYPERALSESWHEPCDPEPHVPSAAPRRGACLPVPGALETKSHGPVSSDGGLSKPEVPMLKSSERRRICSAQCRLASRAPMSSGGVRGPSNTLPQNWDG